MKISMCCTTAILATLLCYACGRSHFIPDKQQRQVVEQDFRQKMAFFGSSLPFPCDSLRTPEELIAQACRQTLTNEEAGAMVFLYAYMPATDMQAQSPEFYLRQVRAAFEARETFAWGKQVPELLFRHFVLPPRVNNEDMDSCRTAFLRELQPRLQGLTMTAAALEVNHWCHEKVTYTPTDGRTAGPLAVVARAYGRCGEESVFTVAALRAVGIPARQVYTPRWAHTDDNHAWVEVWADGAWHYMGACEPEPVLDRAWFTAPSQRAMLANTWVFGRYDGPEEVLSRNECYTEVNVLPVYAPTKQAVVVVQDTLGRRVEGATVEFCLYNYAEFYPVARRTTGADGTAVLTTGRGTLVVQATKEHLRAIMPYSVPGTDTLLMVLRPAPSRAVAHYRLVPPPEGKGDEVLGEEVMRTHAVRLHYEDSLRMAYMASFPFACEQAAAKLAAELELRGANPAPAPSCGTLKGEEFVAARQRAAATIAEALGIDAPRAVALLQRSTCNGREVERFLRQTPPQHRTLALDLLEVLPEKDLREVPETVLRDHLDGVFRLGERYRNDPLYKAWVLQPRVAEELITPYRHTLWEALRGAPADDAAAVAKVRQMLGQVGGVDGYNPRGFLQSPEATLRSGRADDASRRVFGVAMLRTLGIPARIDEVSGRFQAYAGGGWIEMDAPADEQTLPQASLRIDYTPQEGIETPKYETHYTLGRREGGGFSTLGLYDGKGDIRAGEITLTVPAGEYRIISGRRLVDGTVLVRAEYFQVQQGIANRVELHFEPVSEEIAVIGAMNPEARYLPDGGGAPVSILQTTGRGLFVLLAMDAAKEPSRHLTGELIAYAAQLQKTGLPIVCLLHDRASLELFKSQDYRGLPPMHYGCDMGESVLREVETLMECPGLAGNLPLVMVADTFGKVYFFSSGYRIGLGEALMEVCRKVKK